MLRAAATAALAAPCPTKDSRSSAKARKHKGIVGRTCHTCSSGAPCQKDSSECPMGESQQTALEASSDSASSSASSSKGIDAGHDVGPGTRGETLVFRGVWRVMVGNTFRTFLPPPPSTPPQTINTHTWPSRGANKQHSKNKCCPDAAREEKTKTCFAFREVSCGLKKMPLLKKSILVPGALRSLKQRCFAVSGSLEASQKMPVRGVSPESPGASSGKKQMRHKYSR